MLEPGGLHPHGTRLQRRAGRNFDGRIAAKLPRSSPTLTRLSLVEERTPLGDQLRSFSCRTEWAAASSGKRSTPGSDGCSSPLSLMIALPASLSSLSPSLPEGGDKF